MRNHHRLHDGSKEDLLMKEEFHEESSQTSWWVKGRHSDDGRVSRGIITDFIMS